MVSIAAAKKGAQFKFVLVCAERRGEERGSCSLSFRRRQIIRRKGAESDFELPSVHNKGKKVLSCVWGKIILVVLSGKAEKRKKREWEPVEI